MANSISLPPVLIVCGQPWLNDSSIVTAYTHLFPTPGRFPLTASQRRVTP